MIIRFLQDESGQDLVEWGLLAAFISIVALLTIKLIGPLFIPLYEKLQSALTP